MLTVLISTIVLAIVGLALGLLIGFAAKKFDVEVDPRVESVQELLPGANCGGCGYAGCADFASAIIHQNADPSNCNSVSSEALKKIGLIAGHEITVRERKVAVVFCSGSYSHTSHHEEYNGIMDCRSASLVGDGDKECHYGCLGYGSCARVCKSGAIEIRDRLAFVHPELCIGCGRCTQVCPRKLIRLVPITAKVHIYCSSLNKPLKKRASCMNPCLACKKCAHTDSSAVVIQPNLLQINYSNPPAPDFPERVKCPTGVLATAEQHLKLELLPANCTCGKETEKK